MSDAPLFGDTCGEDGVIVYRGRVHEFLDGVYPYGPRYRSGVDFFRN